ncbi:transglutaminase [Zhengella mangrovi]|uniref:Transglutaminase n=1 Tax=Zhengella mangrovi TaxID=1982044 RepID=A0A2G1QTZ0_9HYPH|nr:transglutaminase-like cysteine peptidase [Zhengella mangrovi]PHP68993.1 transglutaminase [Zhengella mangrovi]
MKARISAQAALVVAAALLLGTGGAGIAASSSMTTGGLTSQPIGHYEFCRANPDECSIHMADNGPSRLSASLWRKLNKVNVEVNRAITPMNDYDIYGKDEVWTYPGKAGDCEDYVLEKRRDLSRAGVPLSNLLITVVRKPDGEGHAVLTVRTDKGDYILDNLSDRIRLWSDTGYRFLKRQSSTDTGRWVSLRTGASSAVASVR